jgi:cysteine desulfurase/selenocysteine lyase
VEKLSLDRLVGNTTVFPILDRRIFFDHAATSPINSLAARALADFALRSASEPPSWPVVAPQVAATRAACASLIGALDDEVAFIKNTSEGLSTAAFGISWKPGDRVVIPAGEYPSNLQPWVDARDRYGAELVVVPIAIGSDGEHRVSTDRLFEAASSERTVVLSLSQVEFATGQRFDLAPIGRFCRERGIIFCVDAIQAAGVFPIDVNEMSIDVLAADGHKWLLSTAGTGFLYVRRAIQPRVRPLSLGWLNTRDGETTPPQGVTLVDGARRYEAGSLDIGGLVALETSINLLRSVGIERIRDRIHYLTSCLQEGLLAKGYVVASPRGGHEWSGIISFTSVVHASETVARALKEQGIDVAVRQGMVRAAPHFYNTDDQVQRLISCLPE